MARPTSCCLSPFFFVFFCVLRACSYNPVPWSKRQKPTSANTADMLLARRQGFNSRCATAHSTVLVHIVMVVFHPGTKGTLREYARTTKRLLRASYLTRLLSRCHMTASVAHAVHGLSAPAFDASWTRNSSISAKNNVCGKQC